MVKNIILSVIFLIPVSLPVRSEQMSYTEFLMNGIEGQGVDRATMDEVGECGVEMIIFSLMGLAEDVVSPYSRHGDS